MNPKDHDARSRIKKNHNPSRLGPASARIDAQATAARERAAAVVTATKRYDGDIWMDAESSNRRELVRLEPPDHPVRAAIAGWSRRGSDIGDSGPEDTDADRRTA